MKGAFSRFVTSGRRSVLAALSLAASTAALLVFVPLVLPAQDLLPGPARAVGHCECVNCELARGMAVDRYSYNTATEDSEDAGRAAMTRASAQANTEAHAANPLCQPGCTPFDLTYHFGKPSFFSANPPGKGEAHARWRVTGSCKKPPEQPKPGGQVQPPNENPPKTPSGGAGGSQTTPGTTTPTYAGINGEFAREMHIGDGDKVEIAPMETPGSSTPGAFVSVPAGNPWGGLLGIPGIEPGKTTPKELKGKPGVLKIIKDSNVVNDGGTRATLGYFIRVTHKDGTVETYFILMSYDYIVVNGVVRTAFEVFKFGPLNPNDPNAQPALIGGLAVDPDGNLLPAVPLDIAHVSNFLGGDKNKPVTPGVDKPDEGCLECHSQTDDFPSETLPFPWIAKPKKPEKTEDSSGGLLKNLHIGIGVGIGGESGGGHHEGRGGNETQHGGGNNTPPPEPQNNTPPPNEGPNNQPPPPPGNR